MRRRDSISGSRYYSVYGIEVQLVLWFVFEEAVTFPFDEV